MTDISGIIIREATADMEAKTIRKAYLAVLTKEIHSIHHANRSFWGQKNGHSREDRFEYYRRQDRLEAIRRELAALTP
jgi:hypothetical protein